MTLSLDSDKRITDMKRRADEKANCTNMSMDMYIMDKHLLIELVRFCHSCGGTNLLLDGVLKNLHRLKVYGYKHKGYVAPINSVQSYYKHNLELLEADKWQELFLKAGLIQTKVKDEAPTKYNEDAKLVNTMVANGCVIDGQVENSILFRGVKVHKGARIKNSIIMQQCYIAEGAVLENVICDKGVMISPGRRLKGEKSYPMVIAKGSVV
jgi:glucose-1-phosphate adenylyltransferase